MVVSGARVVLQDSCVTCSLMSPGAGADLASRSAGAHRCVGLHLAVAVTFGLPEGVVRPKGILEGAVLWSLSTSPQG